MKRVLIVDDNEANLYLLRALLHGHGYAVDQARHGAGALAAARANPPDLTVSDLLMPVMDGYTLLRHWRADESLMPIPFVVYTATYTEPKDERLAMALGADAFIIKPAEPDVLMDRIREVLTKRERGELRSAGELPMDEQVLLKEYNEVLVHKLEKKARQLEQANLELRKEIAEREQTEAELRVTEERYRTLFDAITDPLYVYDRETLGFLAVNDAAVARYGFSREEFLGMTIKDIRPPEDVPALLEMLSRAGSGHVGRWAWRHRKKDGTVFDVETFAYSLDFSGRPACLVQARDVTERRDLEEQLRQAQKMEAIGRLAGGVAHDFNNLLTVITGHSDLLLSMPDLSEDDRESITAIQEAGERAAALTRQLLGFSRQTMLQPKVLDVNEVVEETGKMLRRLIGEDILFTTLLAPDLSHVKVDPGQLDQVLMNLAINARDAMPRGGALTVETANVVLDESYKDILLNCQPGPHVMLAMTDNGCGMTRDIQARVFEPFFTTKKPGKGTGLGLAMVFGIVQQSGGCIHVYSEPGSGSTFRIYLPAADEPIADAGDPAVAVDLRGTETILLVEDDEAVRRLALRCLEMNGYTALTAVDGTDALRVVADHTGPLDLVLTDVVMPNMGGPELVRGLRAQIPELKVLFTSGYTDDAVVRHGLLQANVAFLQKPYTPMALAQKLRHVLDDSRAGSA